MNRSFISQLVASGLALVVSPLAAHADVTVPFTGVTLVDHGDRALAIADLCAPGVSFRTTTYAERQATPEAWASNPSVNAVVATNADFFDFPGWTYVVGRARAQGQEWPANDQNKENRTYWQFGPAMADLISPASTPPLPNATQIIGGHNVIIRNGLSLAPNFDGDSVILGTYRRTGFGLGASRSKMYVFASNTALSGASMAASMLQMAAEGGYPDLDVATNEDGGGSSQMYVRGRGQIIDSGRQVNNHIGVIANGSGPSPMCWHRAPTLALSPRATHCGAIETGHGLARGQDVGSCDGRFTLMQQPDGNAVLYGPKGKALWSTQTANIEGYLFVMQTDGNLVEYSPYGFPGWNSGSSGHPGASLAIQDDGNLVVYSGSTALWNSGTEGASVGAPTTPTEAKPPIPAKCGEIDASHGLGQGDALLSCDRRFTLTLQSDGNLVLYQTADMKPLWSTETQTAYGYALWMQADGNLTLSTPYEMTLWSTATGGHPGARLALQNDGNLVVYDGSTALWNSGTLDPNAPTPPPPATDAGTQTGPDSGAPGDDESVESASGCALAGDNRGAAGFVVSLFAVGAVLSRRRRTPS